MSTKATTTATTTTTNANANVQENVQSQPQTPANVQENEIEIIKGIVKKVMLPEGNDERISFVLDKEFTTIDFKTGELKTTNIFGMNIYAVVNQVGQFVPEIQLADTLAMGKMVNPQIIGLSMTNAEIEIQRETHNEGEQRKNTDDVYARNCKTTEFVKVKPNIKPIFAQMLMQIVTTAPAVIKTTAIPNPFGM